MEAIRLIIDGMMFAMTLGIYNQLITMKKIEKDKERILSETSKKLNYK